MLLRKISQHVRSQNWPAVFLDFCVVVVGIFLGLQADNWNQSRIDKTEERKLLFALSDEFAKNDVLLAKV